MRSKKEYMVNMPGGSKKLCGRPLLIVALFIIDCAFSFSQEVLTDLTMNPVVAIKYRELKNSALKINSIKSDTVSLPFLDDFSKDGVYPEAAFWLDSNVFINRDYPFAPPTLGVATFDGLGKTGCPYDTLAASNSSASADTLTSKPINLFGLPPDSTVVLSFYWQAKGRGNDPESSDTLLLQFKDPSLPDSVAWKTVWYKNGYNPATSDTAFRLVVIPIANAAYLKNGFQFRFRNYATVSGNVDHWHIDYVFLDKSRSLADTVFSDVAFGYKSFSLLKNYQAMPWEQYVPSEMKSNLSLFIRNNDTVAIGKNTGFDYDLYDNSGSTVATYSGGNANIDPYVTNGFYNNPAFAKPCIGTNVPGPACTPYSFPLLTDTASFELECAINASPDKNNWNDTLRYKQNFYNYYAYDDGTEEAGYGLNVYGGQIAYKFSLNTADTLVAVQMLFNWVTPNVNQRTFKIRVWNDAGGIPGSIIYEDTITTPNYQYVNHSYWGNLTNAFYTYKLSVPKILSGTFYVGWVQYTSDLLNIGFDKNINSNSKMFFNTAGTWGQSVLKGSWMIRPVFRKISPTASVADADNATPSFTVSPNPTNGLFKIRMENGMPASAKEEYFVSIFNITGHVVYQTSLNSSAEIDISHLSEGMYFLRVSDTRGWMKNEKIILVK